MNLYEINAQIQACIMPSIDADTGELIEELIDVERLAFLQMEKDTKVENIAKWVKNLKAEAEALKVEKMRLADRQKRAENKIESLTRYLQDALAGEKFKSDDGTIEIRYRKSKKFALCEDYKSEADIVSELEKAGRYDLLTVKEPTLNKTAIKNAILKDGEYIDGCNIIDTVTMQIN